LRLKKPDSWPQPSRDNANPKKTQLRFGPSSPESSPCWAIVRAFGDWTARGISRLGGFSRHSPPAAIALAGGRRHCLVPHEWSEKAEALFPKNSVLLGQKTAFC
jgi:hypothetical protein